MNRSFKMKLLILVSIMLIFLLGSGTAKEVTLSVNKLIQRICAVARDKLHTPGATPESRQAVINSMKEKLRKTSEKLERENIRTVIEGVMMLSTEENYQKLCNDHSTSSDGGKQFNDYIKKAQEGLSDPEISKGEVVQKNPNITLTEENGDAHMIAEIKALIGNMEKLMLVNIKDDMSVGEKLDKAKQLKSQFLEAFRSDVVYQKSEKFNDYLALAEQGMNLAIEKLVKNLRRSKDDDSTIDANSLVKGVKLKEIQKNVPKANQFLRVRFMPFLSKNSTTTTSFPGVTKDFGCKDILKDTCHTLKGLNKLTCDYDGTTLEMQQVCDGTVDCPDGSDEKDCIKQVLGKIHNASQVMAKLELSQYCLKSIIDKSLLSKQGELLASLLATQVDFLNKYAQQDSRIPSQTRNTGKKDVQKKFNKNQSINELAYEVAVIIRSFGSTLSNALCYVDGQMNNELYDIVEDLDKEVEQLEIEARTTWMPSSCKCNDQYCADMNCNSRCKRYCYQIYSLQNFNCKPIEPVKKSYSSVPLDLVCDGKPDCFDETDEINCLDDGGSSKPKIKGRTLFDQLINFVKSKSTIKEFSPVRVEIGELLSYIRVLQIRSTALKLDNKQIKDARDKCFSKLEDIFETMLEEGKFSKPQQELIYDFLLTIHDNLISALKNCHFGNKKIISEEDCTCQDTKCLQVNCPQRCARMCAVKPLFTNYTCSSSGDNVFIPIDDICNGHQDCPNGEDELDCKKDVCRVDTLKMMKGKIRRNIKIMWNRYRGTNIGDILENWRTKVVSQLTELEEREIVTLEAIKDSVVQILNDLAMKYASLSPTHHPDTDNMHLNKFAKLSQYVMEMLKECNN